MTASTISLVEGAGGGAEESALRSASAISLLHGTVGVG